MLFLKVVTGIAVVIGLLHALVAFSIQRHPDQVAENGMRRVR